MSLAHDVDFAVGEGVIRDLLERNGITPDEVGRLHRIKDVRVYQGLAKIKSLDEEGNEVEKLEVQDMASVVLHPKWEEGPEWPVVQPGPLFKPPTVKVREHEGAWKEAFIIPDMQIGYYHGPDGELISTHDETAIDLVLQIIKKQKPDMIVMVGDNMDFPEFGRYRLSPAFAQTTQASIEYATTLMYRFRTAAPQAQIIWLAGNHDERLPLYIMDNAGAAFGLKQGKHPLLPDGPENYPVLSIPHLLHLDLSGVEYLPGYPANEFWINERLKVIHGKFVKSRGSTSHKYLDTEKASVIYGHIHRIEDNLRTFDKWGGSTTIRAASPGTLARTTGAVPSTKGGLDLYGRPLTAVEDWQQGFGHVRFKDTGEHEFFYHNHHIVNGMVDFNGKVYEQEAS